MKIKTIFSTLLVCLALSYSIKCTGQSYVSNVFEGKSIKTIAFKKVQGFILVDVIFNDILPLKFIFDTGASHNILFEKKYIDLFSIPYDQEIKLYGADLKSEVNAHIVRNIKLNLDGKVNVKKDIIILDENLLFLEEQIGIQIDGIIGGNYFSNLVVEIDYKKNKIHLHDPNKFEMPTGFSAHPIEVRKNKPYIKNNIIIEQGSTPISLEFLLDTGAAIPFLLHINSDSLLTIPDKIITGNIGKGLGGILTGYVGKTQMLDFASFSYMDLITIFQDLNPQLLDNAILKKNGLIGNEILSRFHIIIDYMRQELYLKAEKNFNKNFKYDKSGLIVFSFGTDLDKFYIKEVIEDSAAFNAGIQPGDIIKSINGKPSSLLNLTSIFKLLSKKEGKKIKMKVIRNDEKRKFTFTLKDYLK